MEVHKLDQKQAQREQVQQERERKQAENYEKAMQAFRKSRAHKYIIEMIDDRIAEVTDTRQLAENFGKIKGEVIGELGTLGVASLMASKPLEELKEELSEES